MKPTLKKKVSISEIQKKGGIDSFIQKELKSMASKPAPSPKPDFKSPLANAQKMSSQASSTNISIENPDAPTLAFQKPPKIIHSINKDALPKTSKPFTISKGLLKKVDYKPPGSSGSSARGEDPEAGPNRGSQEPLFNTPIRGGKEGFNTLQVPEETKSYQKPKLLIKKHDRDNSASTGKSLSPSPSADLKIPKKNIKAPAGPSLLIKGATPLANRDPSLTKLDKKPPQAQDEQEDGYGDSDFEDFEAEEKDGQKKEMILNKIAKIMKKENEKAANFEPGLQDIQKGGGNKRAPFQEGKIEMGRGIKVGTKKTVTHGTVNAQRERTRDLKKIIDLGQSDFQDLFNIDPSCEGDQQQRLINDCLTSCQQGRSSTRSSRLISLTTKKPRPKRCKRGRTRQRFHK